MAALSKTRLQAIVAAALVVAAALGYWGYGAYKKNELRKTVAALLTDAGTRLRAALEVEAGSAPIDRPEAARQSGEHADAMERRLARLRELDVERDLVLADDADSHLVTAREIFRRQAAGHSAYSMLSESVGALRDHMRADNRTGEWIGQAVKAKERAERDFRDYQTAVAVYAKLLGSLPVSQMRIAPRVEPAALVDEALIARARDRALEAAKQSAKEMDAVRKLLGPR